MSNTTLILKIEMRGFWHCSSGNVAGALIDATCKRDASHLPMLGGRALKGLLREAVRQAGLYGWKADGVLTAITPNAYKTLFGTDTSAGTIRVGSARVDGWAELASATETEKATLFRLISSTALDNGIARDKSLRCIEVAVPLTLSAEVSLPTDDKKTLLAALPLITELGGKRARGFGRCEITTVPKGNP